MLLILLHCSPLSLELSEFRFSSHSDSPSFPPYFSYFSFPTKGTLQVVTATDGICVTAVTGSIQAHFPIPLTHNPTISPSHLCTISLLLPPSRHSLIIFTSPVFFSPPPAFDAQAQSLMWFSNSQGFRFCHIRRH